MKKSNLKQKVKKTEKTKRQVKIQQPISNLKQEQEIDIATIWSSEISQLKKQKFESLDLACEALIDLVLNRLNTSNSLRQDTKQFLKSMILTDPEFSDELENLVG